MDAPVKLYVANVTFPDGIDWEGSPINSRRIETTDIEYIRKDCIEHIIRGAKGPQDALYKLYSL